MVYLAIEMFDKCIQDCDNAINLKGDFAKVTFNLNFRRTSEKVKHCGNNSKTKKLFNSSQKQ